MARGSENARIFVSRFYDRFAIAGNALLKELAPWRSNTGLDPGEGVCSTRKHGDFAEERCDDSPHPRKRGMTSHFYLF